MPELVLPPGDENTWKGAFGERWFETLCSAAGCAAAKLYPDVVHSDYAVHDPSWEMIRAQIKTTEHPVVVGNDSYSFQVDIGTYDRLRQGNTPGYLVLVVLHRLHPLWTRHFARGTAVRATAHWVCLAGLEPKPLQASVTVALPFANLVTPASILTLFPQGGE